MGINIFDLFSESDDRLIPSRDPGAVTGAEFIKNNINSNGPVRENNILNEFLHGNIPDFLRKMVPITITKEDNSITYLVMSDYLSIGNNESYIRMPMTPHTAQAIADKYDCSLPTVKMVKDIWNNSINKLKPLPWGPPYDHNMMTSDRISAHNQNIQKQLLNKDYTKLTSGHKKDVVISNVLAPNNPLAKVAIYGWITENGYPIQELNVHSHNDNYADYSHGIRLISKDVIVNGKLMRLENVFTSNKLANLVSDEGPLSFWRY